MNKTNNLIIGCTTAYEIQANELREAILTDNLRKKLEKKGQKVKVFLFNDDIDSFTKRHLKIASKDNNLPNLENEIGKAIYRIKINDNLTLSYYFLEKLINKLNNLGIRIDEIINSSEIREKNQFRYIKNKLLRNKSQIMKDLKNNFGLDYSEKFFKKIHSNGYYSENNELYEQGKFPWAIECMIRWILLDVDYEHFTKNYLTYPCGSYYVSKYLLENYFSEIKTNAPYSKKFEYVHFSKNILKFYNLLNSSQFKALMSSNKNKVDYINQDCVLKILKNHKFKNSDKNYFDVFYFLSHFRESNFFSEEFINNLNSAFFQKECFTSKDSNYFEEKLEIFKELFFDGVIEFKEYQLQNSFGNNLKKIMDIKENFKEYEKFKEILKKELSTFSRDDYIKINRKLFGKDHGISLPIFLFIIPSEEVRITEVFYNKISSENLVS